MLASSNGHHAMVHLLLEHKASVDLQDAEGRTALMGLLSRATEHPSRLPRLQPSRRHMRSGRCGWKAASMEALPRTTGRRKARCPGFYKSLSNRPGTDLKMVGLARRAEVSSVHLKYVLFAEGRGHYRWSSPSSPLTGGS